MVVTVQRLTLQDFNKIKKKMFFLIPIILTWFFQLFPQDKPPEQDR